MNEFQSALSEFAKSLELFQDASKESALICEAASKVLSPTSVTADSLLESAAAILDFQNYSATMNATIKLMQSQLEDIRLSSDWNDVLSSMASAIQSIDFSSLLKGISEPDIRRECHTDYVAVSETAVKEYRIPDELIFSTSRFRVRIPTAVFISIVFGLISVFSFVSDQLSSIDTANYQSQMLELQREQNQILHDLFDSVDASNSSQAEIIEHWKEILPAADLTPAESESAPSSPQSSSGNNQE